MKNKFYYFFFIQTLFSLDFAVLTYNIHGLNPIIAGDAPQSRIPIILERSKDYDFILIQENWIFSINYFSKKLPNHKWIVSHNSKFSWPIKSWINSNGSGLTMGISSDYKILNIHEERFSACSGWFSKANDCLATKGFQHISIEIDGEVLDLYNTHLDAGNAIKDVSARKQQIEHLTKYIDQHSAGRPIILAGDLNINYFSDEKIVLSELANELNLKILDWVNTTEDRPTQVLDYILFRNSSTLDISVIDYGVDINLNGLSDHPPITAVFEPKNK